MIRTFLKLIVAFVLLAGANPVRAEPMLALGLGHSCSLDATGQLFCWGDNRFGQLASNTQFGWADQPQAVVGMEAGAKSVAAGAWHTCAVSTAGYVYCWGYNNFGQLGTGNTDYWGPTPTLVSGLGGNVVSVVAGDVHTCALKADGVVWCWGSNAQGQLGNGNTQMSATPIIVMTLPESSIAISAATWTTCSISTSRTVYCWGNGGTGSSSLTPIAVTGLSSQTKKVSMGNGTYCALSLGGQVRCWQFGQTASLRAGLESGVIDIAVGPGALCGAFASGELKCSGYGAEGAIGATNSSLFVPLTTLANPPAGLNAVFAGPSASHLCATSSLGTAKCWGAASLKQLGAGPERERYPVAAAVTWPHGVISSLRTESASTCAVNSSGEARCWGANTWAQLGDGSYAHRWLPGPAVAFGLPVRHVDGGLNHSCGVSQSGIVKCWGLNNMGVLGDGTQIDRTTPVAIAGGVTGFADVAVGNYHSCALRSTAVYCWGSGGNVGALGSATVQQSNVPVQVASLTSPLSSLTLAGTHACVVANGGVRCWGQNESGQLGNGTTTASATPVTPTGLASGVRRVLTAYSHSCAELDSHQWKCWGNNAAGQLGTGDTVSSLVPVAANYIPTDAVDVALGTNFTCYAKASGGASCWGANKAGSLGNGFGDHPSAHPPADVTGLSGVLTNLASKELTTCALHASGALSCWGNNSAGQVGAGTAGYRAGPGIFVENLNLQGALQLNVSPNTPVFGEPMTLSARVAGLPVGGTFEFRIYDDVVAGCGQVAPVDGVATCVMTPPSAPYTYVAKVRYAGDATHAAANTTRSFRVTGAAPVTFTVTANSLVRLGSDVTFDIAVTSPDGTPSGYVLLEGGGLGCGNFLVGGTLQCIRTATVPGIDQTIFASYSGSEQHRSAEKTLLLSVVRGLDFDGSTATEALPDGLLLLRYLFGVRNDALMAGLTLTAPPSATTRTVEGTVAMLQAQLDIDLDGQTNATTDGLLVLRYLLGLRGEALVRGATAPNGTRRDANEIAAHLSTLLQ